MILSRPKILKAIKEGRIGITPFDESAVGACSIDLTLGKEFRIFKDTKELILTDKLDYLLHTRRKKANSLLLKPNELVLGITEERIRLNNDLCGFLQGRSRIARAGLMVHVSSSLVQPGVDNRQVLEIVNLSRNPMCLQSGVKICQIIFSEVSGGAAYSGEFSKQTKP
jgi:dCTP deaminase